MNLKSFPAQLCALLGLLLVSVGSTYGIFTSYKEGEKENIVTSANLVIVLDDKTSVGISDQNAVPMLDEVAVSKVPYQFALKNTGNVGAHYQLKLVADTKRIAEDGCSGSLLGDTSIKYQLVRDGEEVFRGLVSELTNYVVDEGELKSGDIHNYQLRVWISSTAGNEVMGKHYHGKINAVLTESLIEATS